MRKKGKDTKNQVIEAAIKLFHMYGYNGTSIRAIASEAGVNVALVSYYFGGKKGLLEYLMSSFLEGYLLEIEKVVHDEPEMITVTDALIKIAEHLLSYQQEHYYLARFVHREITMDTMLIRELMVTYLMKEKYLLNRLIEKGVRTEELRKMPVDLAVIHFRELIILPFLQPQYVREVFGLKPDERYFRFRYLKYIKDFIEQFKSNKTLLSNV